MLAILQRMVQEDPSRADTWRLIGGIHRRQDRVPEALDAFNRALSLQPDNAAAHFDKGELMWQLGKRSNATFHFDRVIELAPASGYAQKLADKGYAPAQQVVRNAVVTADAIGQMPNAIGGVIGDGEVGITPAAYEIQTLDGADDLERRLNQLGSDPLTPPSRWQMFVEAGALYNSNVSLTPISRELTGGQAASFQGFVSPDVQWTALDRGLWRSGPLLRGYFTKNEGSFQSLDLASFQPGVFLERDLAWGDNQRIGRVDYVYSLDLLDADKFGERHAITASLTTIFPDADVTYAYITTSLSDFTDDGVTPAVDSLDGTAVTTGISRFFRTSWALIPTWSLGVDGEWANTEGADYRYFAVNLHGDLTYQLTERLSFIPRAGVGYRTYGDFTGPVSRDELTWRASGRLRWQCSERLAISAVAGYDRFASDNANFDTDRTEAGLVLTFLR